MLRPLLYRAVELAEGKYCAVYATLRDAVAIERVVEIEHEAPPT